ncbi:hypothetical protein LY76DRAFT_586501 [Colletotrichum caudatum]|nr:hypothetical protein LY76DRAFT_586501 [Colletotrichum caudatum]
MLLLHLNSYLASFTFTTLLQSWKGRGDAGLSVEIWRRVPLLLRTAHADSASDYARSFAL